MRYRAKPRLRAPGTLIAPCTGRAYLRRPQCSDPPWHCSHPSASRPSASAHPPPPPRGFARSRTASAPSSAPAGPCCARPARSVPVGLRLDGGVMLYGREAFAVAPSPTLPRVALEGTTSNIIATVGVGPQVTVGRGWLRPYGYGTIGLAYFATTSELRGISGGGAFATTTT